MEIIISIVRWRKFASKVTHKGENISIDMILTMYKNFIRKYPDKLLGSKPPIWSTAIKDITTNTLSGVGFFNYRGLHKHFSCKTNSFCLEYKWKWYSKKFYCSLKSKSFTIRLKEVVSLSSLLSPRQQIKHQQRIRLTSFTNTQENLGSCSLSKGINYTV